MLPVTIRRLKAVACSAVAGAAGFGVYAEVTWPTAPPVAAKVIGISHSRGVRRSSHLIATETSSGKDATGSTKQTVSISETTISPGPKMVTATVRLTNRSHSKWAEVDLGVERTATAVPGPLTMPGGHDVTAVKPLPDRDAVEAAQKRMDSGAPVSRHDRELIARQSNARSFVGEPRVTVSGADCQTHRLWNPQSTADYLGGGEYDLTGYWLGNNEFSNFAWGTHGQAIADYQDSIPFLGQCNYLAPGQSRLIKVSFPERQKWQSDRLVMQAVLGNDTYAQPLPSIALDGVE